MRLTRKIPDFRIWHKSEVSPWSLHVRCWVNTGRHLLAARISGFDPQATSAGTSMLQ
jgi:hypothetical protein